MDVLRLVAQGDVAQVSKYMCASKCHQVEREKLLFHNTTPCWGGALDTVDDWAEEGEWQVYLS